MFNLVVNMPLILRIEKQNYAFRQNYDFYDKH